MPLTYPEQSDHGRALEGMMGTGHKLEELVEPGSGTRLARRWRLLLAHDATASTCNALIESIEDALGNVDIYESPSVDDARDVLRGSLIDAPSPAAASRFDLCLVCLDLPPAPAGGVRLAQELRKQGLPVVLVTRSLRWIPASAASLRELPWVTPDASSSEVARAVGEAMAAFELVADATWPTAFAPARHAGGE
ncbi:Hypothetical protein A7982_03660 [Minicystis rosea]|nr:Hypothetical protein A7982_03660 [Minicystis rosea]